MTAISGTNVSAPITPFDTSDTYPTHDASYGKGGFKTVLTVAERDAIPSARRSNGMRVNVTADTNSSNNGDWEWTGSSYVRPATPQLDSAVATATTQAGIATTAATQSSDARDLALSYAGVNYRCATLSQLTGIPGTDSQTGLIAVGGSEDGLYQKISGTWTKTGGTGLLSKLDLSVFYSTFTIGGLYPFRIKDPAGRMAMFTDTTGATFLKFHSLVSVPGTQIAAASIQPQALSSTLFSKMLPDGFTFSSTALYPISFRDVNKRLSELTLESTGRFPSWVAKSLAGRANVGRAGVIGRSVRLSEVYCDVTELPDGSTIPVDTGQASVSFGNSPLKVVGGQIVHDAIQSSNNAGYLQVSLAKKVRKIGCTCVFPTGSELSTIALVLPLGSWTSVPGGTAAGVHYVMLGNGSWHCSIWNAGETIYAAGTIASLADGVTRMIDIEVDGNTVTVKQPDGSVSVFTDTRITSNISNLAIWELYESTSQASRAAIKAFWAESPAVVAAKQDSRPMAVSIQSFLNGY